jgi:hypothetical protein
VGLLNTNMQAGKMLILFIVVSSLVLQGVSYSKISQLRLLLEFPNLDLSKIFNFNMFNFKNFAEGEFKTRSMLQGYHSPENIICGLDHKNVTQETRHSANKLILKTKSIIMLHNPGIAVANEGSSYSK